ncbi:WD40-repeat-containing domain protein [Gymnopilus junonius]|uniref:WD40-repeat-containing domain protein n=1 Tax=Gymnopilus junonius TaxID=109634 RepID=A0A9P5NVD5_GYMJU|nr:WD40-repeat-containing domain protein [Gymnopilus junonius]
MTTDAQGNTHMRVTELTLRDLARLLGSGRGGDSRISRQHPHVNDDGEDDEDYMTDDDDMYSHHQRTRSRPLFPPVTEPQKEGLELLASGDFGRVGVKNRTRRNRRNIARTVLNQGKKSVSLSSREDVLTNLVPNTNGTTVATYDANMYTAQFSGDSSFYYTCAQDFKLHIFDMRAPLKPELTPSGSSRRAIRDDVSLTTRMPIRKVVQGHPGRWTITDANLSPDNERLIYSSITPTVYMTSTSPDGSSAQIPIPFSDPTSRHTPYFGYGDSFGIWSCRFSADGNEVVAGGSGKIFVYDLLANKRTVKISAHTDDVNSCCWADTASGNVLVSASDDTFIKVWDRRSLGESRKPSGVLVGHTEGITYVSAKGDGRYVISNGKDQALRLWDLRKMRSSSEFDEIERDRTYYGIAEFDYRYPYYPEPNYPAHPKDCSVMTYRGHSVLRTLIRCHFSPVETTGSQYIYSGSADGKVHIWSLDGRIVQVLDRSKTLPATFSPSGREPEPPSGMRIQSCVRDVSWHSQEPVIMSAGWENAHGGTVIARHEFKGLLKLPGGLEDWVERQRQEESEDDSSAPRRSARLRAAAQGHAQHMPGSFYEPDEDDEDF